MQTIAIVNEKGGSGKTTTAVNLSAALGELQQKVLLVDLDGQAASSRWLGVEEDVSFADALWRGEGLRPIPDVIPGVSLAPGSGKLDSVAHDLRPTQGGQLHKLLSQTSGFEYVIIDCPPSLGNRLIGNALLAATHAIVPVETSILALDGLKILLTTLDDIRNGFGHEIGLAGVLACRFDARTKLSHLILTELNRALPGKVFRTVIRENVRVRECPASKQSILTYAPDSHAAEDYRSLARELLSIQSREHLPATAADQGTKGELTEGERQAVGELREQVETMLHQSGSKGSDQASVPPKPECESQHDETSEQGQPVDLEELTAVGSTEDKQADKAPTPDAELTTPSEPPQEDEQTQEAAPAQEEPPAEEASDEHKDYPALREMLRKMTEAEHADEVKVP